MLGYKRWDTECNYGCAPENLLGHKTVIDTAGPECKPVCAMHQTKHTDIQQARMRHMCMCSFHREIKIWDNEIIPLFNPVFIICSNCSEPQISRITFGIQVSCFTFPIKISCFIFWIKIAWYIPQPITHKSGGIYTIQSVMRLQTNKINHFPSANRVSQHKIRTAIPGDTVLLLPYECFILCRHMAILARKIIY